MFSLSSVPSSMQSVEPTASLSYFLMPLPLVIPSNFLSYQPSNIPFSETSQILSSQLSNFPSRLPLLLLKSVSSSLLLLLLYNVPSLVPSTTPTIPLSSILSIVYSIYL